jgi:hypothetical protein
MPETVQTPQNHCRLAIASDDITPPVGIYHRMWGAASHDAAEGVHRPLRGTVLVVEPADGSDRSLLIALDHCIMRAAELDPLIERAAAAGDLEKDSVSVVFSHTHAAGLLGMDRVDMPGGELIPDYFQSLYQVMESTVRRAVDQLSPATMVYGFGHCDLARQRDLWDEESNQYVCGFNPQQPAETPLLAIKIQDPNGDWVGSIVNYGCHPTTLAWENRLISPDFPGAMREVIEQQTGAPCLFVQGICGDLGPRDGFSGDPQLADKNGQQLGHAALATLLGLPPAGTCQQYSGPVVSGATIGTWQHVELDDSRQHQLARWRQARWDIPLAYRDELEPAELVQERLGQWQKQEETAQDEGDLAHSQHCRAMAERDRRLLARLAELPAGDRYPYQVHAWQLGDAIWLLLPGEPYQQLEQQLRARFPEIPILLASNTGPWGPSYLVPTSDYGKGIYQESVAVLKAGCLEELTAHLAERIADWIE